MLKGIQIQMTSFYRVRTNILERDVLYSPPRAPPPGLSMKVSHTKRVRKKTLINK